MTTRRSFITLLGGAAAWPVVARGQQPTMPVVGFALSSSAAVLGRALAGFENGLKDAGYLPGHNVAIEYRFADGQFERLPGFISEFVERKVAVIVTSSTAGALTAKNQTSTIPIVFSMGDDPVKSGVVASLNRPEGNITGVYQFTTGLEGKRLGLLREMLPKASTLAVLIHPNNAPSESQLRDVNEAAQSLGVRLAIVRANDAGEFDGAFTSAKQNAEGVLVAASPFFNTKRQHLVLLATRHGLPAIYEWRDFAEVGGLMSYGTRLGDAYRQAGAYAGLILKGAKPADLPVVQVTKFEFVINLSAAKTLGIDVPPPLSARADEVIE